MIVFGFAGARNSGKDSSFKIIQKLLPGYNVIRVAFADSLKEFCRDYLGVPSENMFEDPKKKEEIIGKLSDYIKYIPEENYLIPVEHSRIGNIEVSARIILQLVGTEIFRNVFNNDIWINVLIKKIKSLKYELNDEDLSKSVVCITDIRFLNEINKVGKEVGAKTIKLERDTGLADMSHSSEAELKTIPNTAYNYIINKEENVDLTTLESALKYILGKEGLIKN